MSIGELAQTAGVSRETVHCHLGDRLLPHPEKVDAGVSFFDARLLARLQVIRQHRNAMSLHILMHLPNLLGDPE